MYFRVRTEADLLQLMRSESALHPFRKPPIRLDIPTLNRAEAAAWQLRLEELRQHCGCTSGAVFLGAFLLANLAYVLGSAVRPGFSLPATTKDLWLTGIIFLAGLIISALFGKLLGLSVSAFRFRRTCRALQSRLHAAEGLHDK